MPEASTTTPVTEAPTKAPEAKVQTTAPEQTPPGPQLAQEVRSDLGHTPPPTVHKEMLAIAAKPAELPNTEINGNSPSAQADVVDAELVGNSGNTNQQPLNPEYKPTGTPRLNDVVDVQFDEDDVKKPVDQTPREPVEAKIISPQSPPSSRPVSPEVLTETFRNVVNKPSTEPTEPPPQNIQPAATHAEATQPSDATTEQQTPLPEENVSQAAIVDALRNPTSTTYKVARGDKDAKAAKEAAESLKNEVLTAAIQVDAEMTKDILGKDTYLAKMDSSAEAQARREQIQKRLTEVTALSDEELTALLDGTTSPVDYVLADQESIKRSFAKREQDARSQLTTADEATLRNALTSTDRIQARVAAELLSQREKTNTEKSATHRELTPAEIAARDQALATEKDRRTQLADKIVKDGLDAGKTHEEITKQLVDELIVPSDDRFNQEMKQEWVDIVIDHEKKEGKTAEQIAQTISEIAKDPHLGKDIHQGTDIIHNTKLHEHVKEIAKQANPEITTPEQAEAELTRLANEPHTPETSLKMKLLIALLAVLAAPVIATGAAAVGVSGIGNKK